MRPSLAVFVALALAGWATNARAALTINVGDSVSVSGTVNNYDAGQVYYNGTAVAPAGYEVAAGAFVLSVTDNTTGQAGTLSTFCTDVTSLWQTPGTFTAMTFADANTLNNAITRGWTAYGIADAAWLYNTYFVGQTGLTTDQQAGLQLAIWKVLYDSTSTGVNLNGGSAFLIGTLKASGFGGGLTAAQTYLANLDSAISGNSFVTYGTTWLDPVSPANNQGLLAPPTPVPEARAILAAVSLLALPLGASMTRILRKKRQGQASTQHC